MPSAVTSVEPAAVPQPGARGEWWLLDRVALAWSLVSALALYAMIGRGGWYVDDFLAFELAERSPLNLRYLEITIFGHPQPGTRVLAWVLYRISPMNYPLAAALICLGFGVTTWLVYRILRMAFRPSPWHLVFTAMVSTTGLWVAAAAWWAAGVEMSGCALASALTVYAMLRCYSGPYRQLWGALAGSALLAGLAFYERTLFGAAFAAWFLPAVTCRSARPKEVLAVLRQAWSGYLALAGVTAGYLLVYLTHQLVPRQPGYTRGELVHFLWVCWSHALIPGLFGGSLRTHQQVVRSLADPPLGWLTGCQLALLALVCFGLVRNRLRAVNAWLVFLAIFLAGQYTIASARLAIYHVEVGNEYRYVADLLPLLVLTLAVTILRPAALPSEAVPGHTGGGSHPNRRHPLAGDLFGVDRRHLLGTAVALVALCVVYLVTAIPMSYRWTHGLNVRYVNSLRAGVGELDRQGPWSLYTTYVPFDVAPASFGNYSETTRIAELVTGHPVSADDLSKPMYVVDAGGHLRRARFRTLASVPGLCSTGPQQILQRLSKRLPLGVWNVQLSYQVATPTTLRFALDPGSGPPVEATGLSRGYLVSGSGQLTFALRLSTLTGLRLDIGAAGACISDVRIGRPVPAS
ncbi:hypothetical protein [Jatrophihabitans sp.]|uniref:hypothetical protein n=1 Tax=Jatrophihabitans sp. TaxID=1932789 RepID=UPI002CB094C1|nr:hypothetical protein [Jatrophihabitans sp.]